MASKKLGFDFFAIEIQDRFGSRMAAISLQRIDMEIYAETFNRMNPDGSARAIVHPMSAAISIANPKSRSA